jgi:hypothetical protein
MAHLNVQPGQIQTLQAATFNGGDDAFYGSVKAVPRDEFGTILDCTTLSALNMTIYQDLPAGAYTLEATLAPSIVSNDATGFTYNFGPGDAIAVATILGRSGNYNFTMSGTLGTDTAEVLTGVVQLSIKG